MRPTRRAQPDERAPRASSHSAPRERSRSVIVMRHTVIRRCHVHHSASASTNARDRAVHPPRAGPTLRAATGAALALRPALVRAQVRDLRIADVDGNRAARAAAFDEVEARARAASPTRRAARRAPAARPCRPARSPARSLSLERRRARAARRRRPPAAPATRAHCRPAPETPAPTARFDSPAPNVTTTSAARSARFADGHERRAARRLRDRRRARRRVARAPVRSTASADRRRARPDALPAASQRGRRSSTACR